MLKTAVLCFTLHLLEKVGGGLQPPGSAAHAFWSSLDFPAKRVGASIPQLLLPTPYPRFLLKFTKSDENKRLLISKTIGYRFAPWKIYE